MIKKANSYPSNFMFYLQEKLEKVLYEINKKGDFEASIISTLEGLSVASISSQYDDVTMAAISSLVREVSKKAETNIGFKKMDEVSLVDNDKFRLVCREFEMGERKFILTVVVPPYKSYRRLTNFAIKEINKIMGGK
ncbi:MAG: hypothetical protein ACE5K0_09380 [Candidatus Methanofastidiosia archaeon]